MDNNIPYEENSVEIHAELFNQDLDDIAFDPIVESESEDENEFGF